MMSWRDLAKKTYRWLHSESREMLRETRAPSHLKRHRPAVLAAGPVLKRVFSQTPHADTAAARSAIRVSTNSLRKRWVRSTNVSLAARQVSSSRLTP